MRLLQTLVRLIVWQMKDMQLVWANRIRHLQYLFQEKIPQVTKSHGLVASADEKALKFSLGNKVPDRVFHLDRSIAVPTIII